MQGRFDATDDQAMDVLDDALQGSWIIEQIFEYIDDSAVERKLNQIAWSINP